MTEEFKAPAETHRCAAERCNVAVQARMLMCRPHWVMVPRPLQNEIYRTYRVWSAAKTRPTPEYRDAVLRATREVSRIELEREHRRERERALAPQQQLDLS